MKKFGLSEFAPLIADAMIPAVKVIPGKPTRSLPVGVSKFGGEPDLPSSSDWPREPAGRPLKLLAQIRLSDLPPRHVPRALLPRRGWLWFWYDDLGWQLSYKTRKRIDWHTWGFQVTFSPSESRPLVGCACPDFPEPKFFKRDRLSRYDKPPTLIAFPQAPVRFKPILSLEHKACHRLNVVTPHDLGDKAIQFYYQSLVGEHQLLGDIDEYGQSDMRESCEVAMAARQRGVCEFDLFRGIVSRRRKAQWRLLMSFCSDAKFDWLWDDGGKLCYWIRERDLARRDFSQVHGLNW